jgi:hypothetical protein
MPLNPPTCTVVLHLPSPTDPDLRYHGCVPVRKRIGEDVAAQAAEFLRKQAAAKVTRMDSRAV